MNKTVVGILHWACRLFLGGIFVYAGFTKIKISLQFAAIVEAYQLLPPHSVIYVVRILPSLEIILGIALLLGILIRYTAGFAGALVMFFIGVMLVTYLRGIDADCGCFGVGERISPFTLARDALFIMPALFLVVQPWLESHRWLGGYSKGLRTPNPCN